MRKKKLQSFSLPPLPYWPSLRYCCPGPLEERGEWGEAESWRCRLRCVGHSPGASGVAASGDGATAAHTQASAFAPLVLMQASGGPSSKTENGLLSPPPEEKLTNSQTSLCEILQEKGRWAGVSLDQSALLPLRFKNIREKTDAHFVDVIKEDR